MELNSAYNNFIIKEWINNSDVINYSKNKSNVLNKKLLHLPKYNGIIYRAIYHINDDEFLIHKNQIPNRLQSWTKCKKLCIEFYKGKPGLYILQVVSQNYGIDLKDYYDEDNKDMSYQEEVITLSHAKYKVCNIIKYNNYTQVILKEL